ncbi:MAG: hypothetical protein JW900_05805, partial [Anaerolineae bacterium]|nr:hypothetical protein [Anaerolineae bacterium]
WTILSAIVGLATFVFFVIVLIKLFQKEGALKGILGIICALYTFIWGWMKHKELGITQIMAIWTVLIIIGMILSAIVQGQM